MVRSLVLIPALLVAGYALMPEPDAGPEPSRHTPSRLQATDSAAVVAAVSAFHRGLERADTAAVRRLLAPDLVVQEGGGVEDRGEYLSHHLPADMAFVAAVESRREVVRASIRGDVAWVASTSRTTGSYRGRALDLDGAELMVLTRSTDGWKISAIHWSSRPR